MKKILMIAALALVVSTLSGCMGERGRIGGQKVCTNEYFLGLISVSELFDPCGK